MSCQMINFATDFYKLTPRRALRVGWEWTNKTTALG